jgi:23S rRNA (cytosine1962-C5)-methyltransferase
MKYPGLILRPGREKSLARRHPWVFSGAVDRVEGQPQAGESVVVRASGGEFLGHAAYSPKSQIVARVWGWEEAQAIDKEFFRGRVAAALTLRESLKIESDAQRLINAESDALPGVIADRYRDVIVLQLLSAGAEHCREALADVLLEMTNAKHVFERSDAEVRELEGLAMRVGPLRGAPPSRVPIEELAIAFCVDVETGHKTGFYLDQRDNRMKIASLAHGMDVLDCFCYSGAFSVHALAAGAKSVTLIDASASALELARTHVERNGFSIDRARFIEGDVFQVLRELRDCGRKFDLIILDPPKFAPTSARVERAARGYKDINLLAFKLLRRGGFLATFSCSGGVSPDLFQKIVAGAALDAKVHAGIIAKLSAAPDHPVALNFPEGEYLKGLIVHVSLL